METKMVQPSFQGFMRATGHAEVWEDGKKFQQFGWRTTTSESAYSTDTLIGNWNEERFDVQKISKAKPLPSQFAHCYSTTYGNSYANRKPPTMDELRYGYKGPSQPAFPGHQPVLDTDKLKRYCNTYMTTSEEAYQYHKQSTCTTASTKPETPDKPVNS